MVMAFKVVRAPEKQQPIVDDAPIKLSLPFDFVFLGRACFIVRNAEGESYEYRVRAKPRDDGSGIIYFLNVKTSGKFVTSYVGVVDFPSGSLRATAKSKYVPGTKEFDVAQWALVQLKKGEVPFGYTILHDGRCGSCHQELETENKPLFERGICAECNAVRNQKIVDAEQVKYDVDEVEVTPDVWNFSPEEIEAASRLTFEELVQASNAAFLQKKAFLQEEIEFKELKSMWATRNLKKNWEI